MNSKGEGHILNRLRQTINRIGRKTAGAGEVAVILAGTCCTEHYNGNIPFGHGVTFN